MRIVCSEDAQNLFTVVPGTLAGRSARSAARRPRFMPCRSWGKPHPIITSTMSARSSSGTCLSAASIANAARSSGLASTSAPLRARPIGVRAAATMTASDKGALSCQLASDDQLLDLARSLVQSGNARVAKVLPDRILVDVPVAAMHLHRGVRRPHRCLAAVVLRDRRLERVPDSGVGGERSSPGEEARGFGLNRDLGEELLHELERCDRPAELLPLLGVGEAGLEAALPDPDAAGGERDAPVVERGQRHLQPSTFLAQHARG